VSGAIADAVDLRVALTIAALAPALGVVFCLRLPAPATRTQNRAPKRDLPGAVVPID
jgi:hypothetical protein